MTRLAFVAAASLALACGNPHGMLPGGKLDGQLVTAPVDDWSFTHDAKTVQLETRPDSPYSVNVWCVAKGANLWVSAGRDSNKWANNMLAEPRVRVRVGERLYERKAVRVTDAEEIEIVKSLYEEKYDWKRDPDDKTSRLLFRLDPR